MGVKTSLCTFVKLTIKIRAVDWALNLVTSLASDLSVFFQIAGRLLNHDI